MYLKGGAELPDAELDDKKHGVQEFDWKPAFLRSLQLLLQASTPSMPCRTDSRGSLQPLGMVCSALNWSLLLGPWVGCSAAYWDAKKAWQESHLHLQGCFGAGVGASGNPGNSAVPE